MHVKCIVILGLLLSTQAVHSQVYVYDRATKKCIDSETKKIGYNAGFGECWDSKIFLLNGTAENFKLNGAQLKFLRFNQVQASKLYLEAANLLEASFFKSRFSFVRAQDADFRGVRIDGSTFQNFSFQNARFEATKIVKSRFIGGDFNNVSFSGSIITDTVFEGVIFQEGQFADAVLINVDFRNCQWTRR